MDMDKRKELNMKLWLAMSDFNRKIDKTQAKIPKLNLEDELSYYMSKSSKDYEKRIASLNRFMKRGAEEVVKVSDTAYITKWELEEYKRNLKSINTKIDKYRASALIDTPIGRIPDPRIKNIENKIGSVESVQNLRKIFEKTRIQAEPSYYNRKARIYKSNYIKALEENGYFEAANIVKRTSASKLTNAFRTNTVLHIGFIYLDKGQKGKDELIINALKGL